MFIQHYLQNKLWKDTHLRKREKEMQNHYMFQVLIYQSSDARYQQYSSHQSTRTWKKNSEKLCTKSYSFTYFQGSRTEK